MLTALSPAEVKYEYQDLHRLHHYHCSAVLTPLNCENRHRFISDGVAQNVRTDGRGRFEFRPFHQETGLITQTNGSAKYVIDH